MANLLQQAGAMSEPTAYAPLHTNRIFTGLWTNRSLLRDAATSEYYERAGMGRQDSILDGRNSEISTRLTLRRRYGNSLWSGGNTFNRPHRFYSFNTFTLTDEVIRVMVDEPGAVYDTLDGSQKNLVWTKSAGAQSTYFLGVGNTLYFTNGVDNMQWRVGSPPTKWGIVAPANPPTVTQQPRPNPYGTRQPATGYATWIDVSPPGAAIKTFYNAIVIKGSDGNLQQWPGNPLASDPPPNNTKQLGLGQPTWAGIGGNTIDGTVSWLNKGAGTWTASFGYGLGDLVIGVRSGFPDQLMVCIHGGQAASSGPPAWPQSIGQQISEGNTGLIWQNAGALKAWGDFGVVGTAQTVTTTSVVIDDNGNLQQVFQMGKSSTSVVLAWQSEKGALTNDNAVVWLNRGNYAQGATAEVRYGYAYQSSTTKDLSNMSPPSDAIVVIVGNQVVVQGVGTGDAQVDTIPIYRLAQGGSTYLLRTTIPNPGAGVTWTFYDTDITESALNPLIQAQVAGQGTPLPQGATALGYHLGRIFAAVGNVVYVSSGPDAIVSGASGNAGFGTTFTAQSKVIRFWACSLGMVVLTVRDAYIILGSATANDPLYMVVFIEQLPLLHYDAFTVNKTTPYMLLGNNMLVALDPGAGIVEVGYPIADRLRDEFNPKTAYVTFHSQSSEETALYVGNANGRWYRMNQNNAPESGMAWSTRAEIANMGALQSVEVDAGVWRLLWGAATGAQAIMQRDLTKFTDNGTPYPVNAKMGSIVLALPGQLAELFFITLESLRVGTRAGLALLLGELSGEFETLKRTRQDPPNLPPSETIFSDRYHFEQNQRAAWCRHFQMEISWPAEDAPNELLTFTIFGQSWQEMRQQ